MEDEHPTVSEARIKYGDSNWEGFKVDYIKEVKRTESNNIHECWSRLDPNDPRMMRILHAVMGLSTEANEALDAMKKFIFYGRPLDLVNLLEEHGDIFWYAAILADAVGFTFEESMEKNINKLRARYPEKFTQDNALNRDLATERKTLE